MAIWLWLGTVPTSAQMSREDQIQLRDHINKGNTLLNRRQFAEAIAEYEAALQLDPGSSAAKENIILSHNNWGILLYSQRKFDDAEAEWELALKMDPNNVNAKRNMAILKQMQARNAQQAQKAVDESLPAPPSKAQGKPGALKPASAAAKASSAPNQTAAKPPEQQSDSQTSTAVILTPGLKNSAQPQVPPELAIPGSLNPAGTAPPPQTAAPASYPSGEEFGNRPAPAPKPSAGASPANNIDDQLAAIEMKVYGQKHAGMPVFKRLERLEIDSGGQAKAGSIKERIDALRRTFGI